MVDFKALHERWIADMTPEQRARYDERQAREARFNETLAPIEAHFERSELRRTFTPVSFLPGRGPGRTSVKMEAVVETEWTRTIHMRIEEKDNEDGTKREIISFKEAVTGFEAYRLDEDFVRVLTDPEELRQRPRFYICAGTAGRWDACWVDPADVEAYLRERRPALFENLEALPAP